MQQPENVECNASYEGNAGFDMCNLQRKQLRRGGFVHHHQMMQTFRIYIWIYSFEFCSHAILYFLWAAIYFFSRSFNCYNVIPDLYVKL